MKGALPKALVHRGVVEAAGFLIDATLAGSLEARRRVLEVWTPGTTVYRVPRGWFVRLASPLQVAAGRAPGLPLVADGKADDALVGAPLEASELRALDPPSGAIVRPRAGHLVLERTAEADREDPSAWLDVEEFAVIPTASLGAPPVQPGLPAPEAAAFDTRTRLKGIPPAAPELTEVLDALKRRPRKRRIDLVLDSVSSLRWGLRGGLHRLSSRLSAFFRLSRLLGRRHAAYIHRMIELFERGDLQEALRYAIPLGGEVSAALHGPPIRLAPPRRDLKLRPRARRTSAAVPMAPDLHGELERLYRTAFERLEEEGRIEEAAFLLAEVLNAHEEAVAFLERHGLLWLAAEMAEARKLPPGLVVRQWFLAGDRERAFWIARRAGAFGDAVSRLERTRDREEAEALRLLWGAGLAEAGDYGAAVEAIWPIAEARRMALEWMDRAIEQGGPAAGRMLARKVTLAPEQFEAVRMRALDLLESWRAEGAPARLAFAETLCQGPKTPEAQTLARAAVRAIARDSGRLGDRMPPARFRQLVAFAEDGALRADAPALPLPGRDPWIFREGLWKIEIAASDVGIQPGFEAAFLANGLTAVALGEAGVRLVSRAGRVVSELDQPAHKLVVSDLGDRAIAMARRGAAWRLARLDLARRRAEPWCDARFEAVAPDYDGALWLTVTRDGLLAVDATSRALNGPWGVEIPGKSVLALSRSSTHCSLLTGGEPEVWTYELPSLQLRSRSEVPILGRGRLGGPRLLAIAPDGVVAEQWVSAAVLHLKIQSAPLVQIPLPGEDWEPGDLALSGDWLAASAVGPNAARAYLVHRVTGRLKAEVVLHRARRVTLRLQKQVLALADDRGRILVLDLENGQIRRDLRL